MATLKLNKLLDSATLNQTMLRIKNPEISIEFYTKYCNMKLIQQKHFNDFSLYFLISSPSGTSTPSPGTEEANEFLKRGSYGCTLELTHNHGTEKDPSFSYHNGNTNPKGFGHVCFLVDDVDAKLEECEYNGLKVYEEKKEILDGISSSSILDPDGYVIQFITRCKPSSSYVGMPSFHHSMLRIKDISLSLLFYQGMCGMTLIDHIDGETKEGKYNSYFLGKFSSEEKENLLKDIECGSDAAHDFVYSFDGTILELRMYHDNSSIRSYHNGNTEPRGFGHLALMVDDVYTASAALDEAGVRFQKKPNEGRMKGLAFILDPDGYWIELVGRLPNI